MKDVSGEVGKSDSLCFTHREEPLCKLLCVLAIAEVWKNTVMMSEKTRKEGNFGYEIVPIVGVWKFCV